MCLIYRLVMPGPHFKSPLKTVKSHKTLINRCIVTMFLFKDEQTGLHIGAERICDRSICYGSNNCGLCNIVVCEIIHCFMKVSALFVHLEDSILGT
jgi:hypothetical protein